MSDPKELKIKQTYGENSLLSVMIRDRAGVLYEGEVEAFSSYNQKGPFDVLPLHTNFISLITKGVDLRLKGTIFKNLPLETGVMKVKENRIEVYIGIIH
jgi:F0F1-type ATP synthase epsilon subunit